jgi:hypothetical protein
MDAAEDEANGIEGAEKGRWWSMLIRVAAPWWFVKVLCLCVQDYAVWVWCKMRVCDAMQCGMCVCYEYMYV